MILNSLNYESELVYFNTLGYLPPDDVVIPPILPFSNFDELVIVGNGQSETPYGKTIDSFKYVCRFNTFKIEGYSDIVGEKTTHHVINSLSFKHIKPLSDDNNIYYILMDTGRPKVTFDYYFENVKNMNNIFLLAPSNYVKFGRFFKNKCKSQGFLFTEVAKLNFQKLHLFGFCSNTHYFHTRHVMDKAHPISDEHDMYDEWASEPNFKLYK